MLTRRPLAAALAALGAAAFCARAQTPPAYAISTVAGSSLIGDGGPATMAQIGNIQGIALDGLGNTYLSDTDRNLVRKIDARGIITTVAGTGVSGYGGDGGPATAAELNLPYGLAADAGGNVYIADLGNQVVRRIAPDGTISTVAGTGVKGSLGDGGPATSAQLMAPRNVALDGAGNLYISEFEGHRVRRVAKDGTISIVAGTGVAGIAGDGGPAVSAQIGFPAGLAVDRAGAVYFADTFNKIVRKVAGGLISTAAGGAKSGVSPISVALDAAGNIFVADGSAVFENTSGWSRITGVGAGFSGDGGPAANALLTAARDLAFDSAGNLFIADVGRIRRIDTQKIIVTVAGDDYLHALGDGGAATEAILNRPLSVALDRIGNLYIVDSGTGRVRLVTAAGAISTFAGTGGSGVLTDAVPAASAVLESPWGVALDAAGDALISDSATDRIREVTGGRISTFAGTGTPGDGADGLAASQTALSDPRGICLSRTGTVFIVDTANNRVRSGPPGGVLTTVAGNGAPGYSGDGGQARAAELGQPVACAVDSGGNLFIADAIDDCVRKVAADGTISTVAGTGHVGNGADGAPATSAALYAPQGVAVDDSGDIFIADTGNHLIRQVTPDGIMHIIAGASGAGFSGDGGAARGAQLNAPAGLAIDGSGAIYFADSGNNRVRRLAPQAAEVIAPPPPVSALATVTAVNAASLAGGAIAPGEIVTIYGTGIGPPQGIAGAVDASGLLASALGGTQVLFDGAAAPLYYAQAGQVNVQAPYTIAGKTTTHVEVRYLGRPVGAADLPVAAVAPAVFPTVLNPDGGLNAPANPAAQGAILTFFATGEGLTTGPNISGQPALAPYAQPAATVALAISGASAQLLYAGEAPGLIGMLQVDAVLPAGTASGSASAVLTVGTAAAQAVSIWVR